MEAQSFVFFIFIVIFGCFITYIVMIAIFYIADIILKNDNNKEMKRRSFREFIFWPKILKEIW